MTDREIAALREWAAAHNEEALLADGLEDAFIGMAQRASQPVLAVYDIEKCIEVLMKRDGMDYDGAEEYLAFNTLDAWAGEMTPLFLKRYDKEET
jgi:hypothetical protein